MKATTQLEDERPRARDHDEDDVRVVGLKDLYPRFGIEAARSTIWKWIQEGSFPRPFHLGQTKIVWLESEIKAWLLKGARKSKSKK